MQKVCFFTKQRLEPFHFHRLYSKSVSLGMFIFIFLANQK